MKCPKNHKNFLWWRWKGEHEPKHTKVIGTNIDHYHVERRCVHCDVIMERLEYMSEMDMQALGYDIFKLRKIRCNEDVNAKELLDVDEILLGED